jgi:hypothetical protein
MESIAARVVITASPSSTGTEPLGNGGLSCVRRQQRTNKTRPTHGVVEKFRLVFAYTVGMFSLPKSWLYDFTVRCKGCGENIPPPLGQCRILGLRLNARSVASVGVTCRRRFSGGSCHTSCLRAT